MAQNEYLVDGADMTTVADAIREKSGTTAPLSFPVGMAEAVRNIQGGGGAVSSVNGKTGAVKLTAEDVGAAPVPMHINLGSYDADFFNKLGAGIMSGKTEFDITIANSDALWEAINNSAGDIWFDTPLNGGGAYSVKVSGMSRDNSGKIFWIDLKISAYDNSWQIAYLGCGGNVVHVKVESWA